MDNFWNFIFFTGGSEVKNLGFSLRNHDIKPFVGRQELKNRA
jgi:hypothetical protein